MTATQDRARAAGFHNEYEVSLAARKAGVGPGVYVNARAAHSVIPAAWQVVSPGYKTDPDGHWANHGNKTFTFANGDSRATQKDAALAWAAEKFGVTEWATVPGFRNVYFPADVATWAKAQIKTANTGR